VGAHKHKPSRGQTKDRQGNPCLPSHPCDSKVYVDISNPAILEKRVFSFLSVDSMSLSPICTLYEKQYLCFS